MLWYDTNVSEVQAVSIFRVENPGCQAHSLVTILTELPRLTKEVKVKSLCFN